ncbi:MAG: GIY-YIG nuclease family protein [Deltaproteobacteria bacterium]|nr:GIY-YIG nuclease family protein [Deltaproteobacteria bacterium]
MNKPLPRTLDDILNGDDEFGLLKDVAPAKPKAKPFSDPVIQNFLEIIAFVEANGREPSAENPSEKLLARRLYSYRINSQFAARVRQYDTYNLLAEAPEQPVQEEPAKEREVTSLEDIFANDKLGLLDDIDPSILQLKHVKAPQDTERDAPDEIAQRKPCADFYNYQRFFEDLQGLLKTNAVMVKSSIKESEVVPGHAFIVRGMICYVDTILKSGLSTTDGRDNPRLRVIFDNGTETNLLRYSLVKALSSDPHSKYIDMDLNMLSDGSVTITQKDRPTGFIYVLGTDSKAPELAPLRAAKKLVKIGYSTQPVEKRIANAEKTATYLFAPVRVLGIISCFNLNPHKFEQLIHAFLSDQRLNVTLKDASGQSYHPEEWFTVDAQTALEICRRILDGSIVYYRMDNVSGKIVRKNMASK